MHRHDGLFVLAEKLIDSGPTLAHSSRAQLGIGRPLLVNQLMSEVRHEPVLALLVMPLARLHPGLNVVAL